MRLRLRRVACRPERTHIAGQAGPTVIIHPNHMSWGHERDEGHEARAGRPPTSFVLFVSFVREQATLAQELERVDRLGLDQTRSVYGLSVITGAVTWGAG